MRNPIFALRLLTAGLVLGASVGQAPAQVPPEPVTFSRQQDYQNMMEQLGITALRPGPSGTEGNPDFANTDESKANPYPDWPEILVTKSGERVTTPEMWRDVRRPEIVEDFEREVLGRVPGDAPAVTWVVVSEQESTVGDVEVIQKQLQGQVDNSAAPSIEVNISATLTLPKVAEKPVPVLMMFSFGGGGGGGGLRGSGLRGRGGASPGRGGPGAADQAEGQPADSEAARQGGGRGPGIPARGGQARGGGRRGGGGPGGGGGSMGQLVGAGWGVVTINTGSIQDDNGGGLTRGVIGLTNQGQPRTPEQWGSLRAWAWGASRLLDYLETEPSVDATQVGIEGVSRFGKAALVAMAMDERFAMALIGSSGEGGVSPYRRNFGEMVENITAMGEYHWMAGNFLKYGASESTFGEMNASDLPIDSHMLIALCAPRLTFISYGAPSGGDPHWLDQQGSYMAAVAAGPVWRLWGAKDLGDGSDDYKTAVKPEVNVGLLEGELAWRQHDGGHTDAPNVSFFIEWANNKIGHTPPKIPAAAAPSTAVAPSPAAEEAEAAQ